LRAKLRFPAKNWEKSSVRTQTGIENSQLHRIIPFLQDNSNDVILESKKL